jgi:hypothetical protein
VVEGAETLKQIETVAASGTRDLIHFYKDSIIISLNNSNKITCVNRKVLHLEQGIQGSEGLVAEINLMQDQTDYLQVIMAAIRPD